MHRIYAIYCVGSVFLCGVYVFDLYTKLLSCTWIHSLLGPQQPNDIEKKVYLYKKQD